MPRLVGVRQIWIFLGFCVLSIVAVPTAPFVADQLLAMQGGAGLRAFAVIVGSAGPVPLIAMMLWLYRRSDEFERHHMLRQWAASFAIYVLLDVMLDQLMKASFITPGFFIPRWYIAFAAWMLGMLAVRIATSGSQ